MHGITSKSEKKTLSEILDIAGLNTHTPMRLHETKHRWWGTTFLRKLGRMHRTSGMIINILVR